MKEIAGAPARPLNAEEEKHAQMIQAALERTLNARRIVILLIEWLGFTDEALGKMTSVHEGTVRRWRSRDPEAGAPRPPQAKAIERVRAITFHFVEKRALRDLRGIGAWFEQIHPRLEGENGPEAPADKPMTPERFKLVMDLAKRFTSPGAGLAGFGPPGYSEPEPATPTTSPDEGDDDGD